MTNKMSSSSIHFWLRCNRTMLLSVVVVGRPSLSVNEWRYFSCVRHTHTHTPNRFSSVQLRKRNYSFFTHFVGACLGERVSFVMLFLLFVATSPATVSLPWLLLMLVLVHERQTRIPCLNGKFLHFYCRRINYPVSILCLYILLASSVLGDVWMWTTRKHVQRHTHSLSSFVWHLFAVSVHIETVLDFVHDSIQQSHNLTT